MMNKYDNISLLYTVRKQFKSERQSHFLDLELLMLHPLLNIVYERPCDAVHYLTICKEVCIALTIDLLRQIPSAIAASQAF